MVKERRSAADALALSPQIEDFISKGITSSQVTPQRPLSIAEKPKQESVANESSQHITEPTEGTFDRELVNEAVSNSESKTQARTPERRVAKPANTIQSNEEMNRMLSKATVQKTVRFQPRLIAQMEAWVKRQEAGGENPPSFQQIQNEALKLWLEKTVN
jgi:hypothetical protein